MRPSKKVLLCVVMVLTLTASFIVVGNLVGNFTPKVSASLTGDEVDICIITNTIMDANGKSTHVINVMGLIDCCAKMNSD